MPSVAPRAGGGRQRGPQVDEHGDEAGREHGVVDLATQRLRGQGDDVVPIPGTRRVRYLEQNVGAADVRLTAEDLAALADAVPPQAVVGDRYPDMSTIGR